jgi:prepilin-type processing-associated H-X9-DG protein
MRALGQAIQMYANNNHGKLPDDLAALRNEEDISPAVFVCPSSSDQPASGPTTRAVREDFAKPGHVSYLYLGGGLSIAIFQDRDIVLMYEPLSNHGGSGMNVLFGDGSVEWVQGPGAQKILAQVTSAQRPVKLPQSQR